MREEQETGPGKSGWAKRIVPVAVLLVVLAVFFASGAHHHTNFETLKENYLDLQGFVESNFLVAALLFVLAYTVSSAASLPVASLLTLLGGFLFGWLLGTVFSVVGATIGATILFTVAHTSFGDALRDKVKPYVGRMEAGFHKNAFSYLLFLRLMPAFPFFVVNLVPAFLGVKTRLFIVTTFIGIIPGSAIYNFIGSGLGDNLASGEEFSLETAINQEIIIGLAGLAIIALAPIIWRKFKGGANDAKAA